MAGCHWQPVTLFGGANIYVPGGLPVSSSCPLREAQQALGGDRAIHIVHTDSESGGTRGAEAGWRLTLLGQKG